MDRTFFGVGMFTCPIFGQFRCGSDSHPFPKTQHIRVQQVMRGIRTVVAVFFCPFYRYPLCLSLIDSLLLFNHCSFLPLSLVMYYHCWLCYPYCLRSESLCFPTIKLILSGRHNKSLCTDRIRSLHQLVLSIEISMGGSSASTLRRYILLMYKCKYVCM